MMPIKQIYEWSLGLTLFLQVLIPKLVPIGFILMLAVIIFLGVKKQLVLQFTKIHLFCILFYLSYLIGTIFTEVPTEAAHVLESKVSFIIVPILFLWRPKWNYNLKTAILLLSIALLLQFVLGIINSFSCYQLSHGISCFVSTGFSPNHHPTYMAIYYLTGFLALFKLKIDKSTHPLFFALKYLTLMVFVLGYIQCMSLSALLFLLLFISIFGLLWFKKRYGLLKSVGLVTAMILAMFILVIQSKETTDDVKYTYESVKKYAQSPSDFVKNANRYLIGNELRLVLWTVSTQAVLEQPFGYGTGNIDLVLSKKLKSYQLDEIASNNYNPHNQYLQTWIEVGVIGLAILFGLFYVIIQFAVNNRNWLLLIVASSFVFNALFESLFQRQSGIVFFVLILFIFMQPIIFTKKSED